jgi:peptide/nickel transport system permease protein
VSRSRLLSRIGQTLLTLFVVLTLMWLLFRLIPGDPAAVYISGRLTPEEVEALRNSWGLDQPLYVQYLKYLLNLLQGSLGISFYYREKVSSIVGPRLLNTLLLMGPAMLLAILAGVMLGAYLGWKRGSRTDRIGVVLGLFMQSFPLFVSGIFVLMLFSYWLGWFPLGGMRSPEQAGLPWTSRVMDVIHHLVLPMGVAALFYVGDVMMISRTSMLELAGEEFLDFGRARGLPESEIREMALRNAIIPVLTYSTIMIGFAFGGQVIVEVVFSWPGIGRLMVESVSRHDYPVAQATFFVMAVVVIALNLVMDLVYGYLDPRIASGDHA